MFINPVSFSSNINKNCYNIQNFGSEKKTPPIPSQKNITPQKVKELADRPRILDYATITVKSKEDNKEWRILDTYNDEKSTTLFLLKNGEQEIEVDTDELCEHYQDWTSHFIIGSLNRPVSSQKPEIEPEKVEQPIQEILSPKSTKKASDDLSAGFIMKTIFPRKDTGRNKLFFNLAIMPPSKYLITVTMKDGSVKYVKDIRPSDGGIETNQENMRIIFKTPKRHASNITNFMTFNQLYKECESINFFNPNYTIGEDDEN